MEPSTSIITSVERPDRERLAACLDSVAGQTSGSWQHVIVCDEVCCSWVIDLVHAHASADDRVVVLQRVVGDARSADDVGLGAAAHPLVMLLGEDDRLAPDAIGQLGAACASRDGVAYSDHDLLGDIAQVGPPSYKPDFSPELLRNTNYIGRPLIASTELVRTVGGFGTERDRPTDHDLALRLTEAAASVAHVAEVLYHRHPVSGGVVGDRLAVADHCARVGIEAAVENTARDGYFRLRRSPQSMPLVSVVIPTRGSASRIWGVSRTFVIDAIASIIERSTYQHLEFVVVYDEATPSGTLRSLERLAGEQLRLVPFREEFNFSRKINSGVAASSGELLLVLNDDTELIEPESIATMVAHLDLADVGVVGAKLLFADGTLQHGGHIYNGGAMHACFGWPGDSPGPAPLHPLAVERECSGVTAAAALVKRSVFEAVGGFATELALNYNDVDFCLKVRAAGHRILWTPYASWYHFESQSRESRLLPEELAFIEDRWHAEMNNDPYGNPHLQPGRHDWLEQPLPAAEASAATATPWIRSGAMAGIVDRPAPSRPE